MSILVEFNICFSLVIYALQAVKAAKCECDFMVAVDGALNIVVSSVHTNSGRNTKMIACLMPECGLVSLLDRLWAGRFYWLTDRMLACWHITPAACGDFNGVICIYDCWKLVGINSKYNDFQKYFHNSLMKLLYKQRYFIIYDLRQCNWTQ